MTSYEHSSRDPQHAGCVVVIDDNADRRQMLALTFETAGFAVGAAATEIELQRILAHCRPVALVIDLQRSETEGLQLLVRLRARRALRGVPILLLAASDDADFREQARRAGADWFGLRPIGMLELQTRAVALIRQATDRKRVS
jgi:DNA-binding response OmpR family regulator